MTDVIVILAAGASRRMRGADKLLEEVDGTPLLRRLAQEAARVGPPVIVALPPPPHARYAALDGLDVTPMAVPECAEGMSGSLRGAVARLPEEATGMLLVLGDLPEIGGAEMRRVLDARQAAPQALIWRGATEDGAPGHPILFDRAVLADFADLTGDDGGRDVIRAHAGKVHLVALPDQRARVDLDTPEAWAAWRAGRQT